MEYTKPVVVVGKGSDQKVFPLLSYPEFKERRCLFTMTNQAIDYNIKEGHLDYSCLGRFRYIVWNGKAKNFTLANSGRKPSHVSKLTL